MNWLAHLHLSPPDAEVQIGSLLPDLLSHAQLASVDPCFKLGITLHHRVDAFTDAHPVFRRSKQRISADLRRYAGIVIDVMYDHFLSLEWETHCDVPRKVFIQDFYRLLDGQIPALLPEDGHQRLLAMRAEDWLSSYQDLDGVAQTLQRISRRLRKPVALEAAILLPDSTILALHEDFSEFYADLQRHVVEVLAV